MAQTDRKLYSFITRGKATEFSIKNRVGRSDHKLTGRPRISKLETLENKKSALGDASFSRFTTLNSVCDISSRVVLSSGKLMSVCFQIN